MALKGGRGRKAPYQTIMIRIPVGIKEEVERLADQCRLEATVDQLVKDMKALGEERFKAIRTRILSSGNEAAEACEIETLKAEIERLELKKTQLQERLEEITVQSSNGVKLSH